MYVRAHDRGDGGERMVVVSAKVSGHSMSVHGI
jgi:hypothetical protein